MKTTLLVLFVVSTLRCSNTRVTTTTPVEFRTIGFLERIDPAFDNIIAPGAKAEIICEGHEWSEGPLWIEGHRMLLYSDVPRDTVFKWTEEKGKEVYLTPSGYTGSVKRGGETGSNGLLLDNDNHLVLCQHGNRQMARMDAPIDIPSPKFITIANMYQGKKLNSPNDGVYNRAGELFFTDPPYGLEKNMKDPNKEIPFQGVYKVKTNGEVVLITDTLTRPNGIAFLPGERTLLVANSDGARPNWYAFDIGPGDEVSNARIFHSAAGYDRSLKGGNDGLKVDRQGNVFATGPGGIWIFNSSGKLLGKYRLPDAASNCALSGDEKTLFVTNDMYVLRLKMRK
ncbi:MAG: SMP-30/gluconolactonase/LRE family protein [Chitinophagaceae bacterium]|nr:SMP-30/gluconolactonase/LRE family protein [Chitinophagaceae bacterium]